MNDKIIKKFLSNRIIMYIFKRICGSEFTSKMLRKTFKKYYQMEIGIGSYGCFKVGLNSNSPIKIGSYCSFANNIQIIPGNHTIEYASTHPYFHSKRYGFDVPKVNKKDNAITEIGNDVWIGADAIILPKCKRIGNGAIIGAGSVVVHDVEPYSIVAGNPAKIIRYRFDNDAILQLEKSKWWELSPDELSEAIPLCNDIDLFCSTIRDIRATLKR